MVEEHHARWILEHAGLPGIEVHHDADAVWQTGEGGAWSNAATLLRFGEADVARRLAEIIRRVQELERPLGFWVSPSATPVDLPARLRERGFRCRKHFPGMHCDLRHGLRSVPRVAGLRFDRVTDHSRFLHAPHPYHGRISTTLRRFALHTQQLLYEKAPDRVFDLIATINGTTVGGALLYLDGECAGVWNVGVPMSYRNRGIGAAITAYACGLAGEHGYRDCVLIASGMGYNVYRTVGFTDECKLSYWYSRLDRQPDQ